MQNAWAGGPDIQEQQAYQYQSPVQLSRAEVGVEARDPKAVAMDWVITTFGASPIMLCTAIGAFVIARAGLKKFGLIGRPKSGGDA